MIFTPFCVTKKQAGCLYGFPPFPIKMLAQTNSPEMLVSPNLVPPNNLLAESNFSLFRKAKYTYLKPLFRLFEKLRGILDSTGRIIPPEVPI